ncbi:Uncharacterised protein [uncultured archaeon]|nr:Uncharacterised protein [uncultured archaeon]
MYCFRPKDQRAAPSDKQRDGTAQFMRMHDRGETVGRRSSEAPAQTKNPSVKTKEKVDKLHADYASFREKSESYTGATGAVKALKDGAVLTAKIAVTGAVIIPAAIVVGAVKVLYETVFLGFAVVGGTLMVAAGAVGLAFTDQRNMSDQTIRKRVITNPEY